MSCTAGGFFSTESSELEPAILSLVFCLFPHFLFPVSLTPSNGLCKHFLGFYLDLLVVFWNVLFCIVFLVVSLDSVI